MYFVYVYSLYGFFYSTNITTTATIYSNRHLNSHMFTAYSDYNWNDRERNRTGMRQKTTTKLNEIKKKSCYSKRKSLTPSMLYSYMTEVYTQHTTTATKIFGKKYQKRCASIKRNRKIT